MVNVILPAVPPPATSSAGPDDQRPVVLVVDDDPSVREVVCAILDARGYRAVAAASGQEALRLATTILPDTVVLDLLMPETNGWEVLGALRDDPTTADVPIVVLSALAENEGAVARESYEAWVDKPFDEATLVAAVRQAVDPQRELHAVLVEDDEDLAEVLKATFERHGIRVTHAATAQRARALLPSIAPDLIILDLRLPDDNGIEVLHDLRAAGHLRGVPVVVYTGYELEPEERRQLDRDGAIVFTKTRVPPEEFEERVVQLVGALTDGRAGRPGEVGPAGATPDRPSR